MDEEALETNLTLHFISGQLGIMLCSSARSLSFYKTAYIGSRTYGIRRPRVVCQLEVTLGVVEEEEEVVMQLCSSGNMRREKDEEVSG